MNYQVIVQAYFGRENPSSFCFTADYSVSPLGIFKINKGKSAENI
jgi:hypothetical protein